MRSGETIDPRPFLDWVDRRLTYMSSESENPHQRVLLELGWGESEDRRMRRWDNGDPAYRTDIENALDHAGVDLAELYPELAGDVELITRYCGMCEEDVSTDSTLLCPWCESRTVNSRVCPSCGGEKSGSARVCVACVPRGEHGRVQTTRVESEICGCGGTKSKWATTCWFCYVAAGSHTGRKVRKGNQLKCITQATLLRARALYSEGQSIRAVARIIYPNTTYANERSCASQLFDLFHVRGWKMRDQSSATAEANRQRAFRPRCAHIHNLGSKKGHRCEKQSVGNDGFCWKHHPENMERGIARLRSLDRRKAA